ncbi:hypothetical protein C8R46DRAFT_1235275 [Mycena filopes]|nr:hypothetical protein C8R46DRAFT_1235275 [Mycena filopes]
MLVEAWHHVLKGKFLHNKRNRRIDHLLSTLTTEVLPYYALKQRRQDLGFEGIDIEVRKRQDITKRSKQYVKEDIEHVEGHRFLVRSKTDPSCVYEVDVETYTCTCADFPQICFCKHLCAVQALFETELNLEMASGDNLGSPTLSETTLPNESSALFETTPPDESSAISETQVPDSGTRHIVNPKASRSLTSQLAEKLERLAARLRRPQTKAGDIPSFTPLDNLVDVMLVETDNGSVLPSSQHVAPNVSGWRQTCEAMKVLPKVKTRKPKAGDAAYSGGTSSGSKAGKKRKKSVLEPSPPPAPPPSVAPISIQPPPQLPAAPPHYYGNLQPQPHVPYYYPVPQ